MYDSTSLRPPRPLAGALGSIAAARSAGHAVAPPASGTPRITASAIAISALAPSIVPVSPIASGHFGYAPRPSSNPTSERATSCALSGASHAYSGETERYVSHSERSDI